jgi:hypothetical protein
LEKTPVLCVTENEREIIKISRSTPDMLINSCSKIHGTCHHKPRFHRYHKQFSPSADERKKHEKVVLEAPNIEK